MASVVTAERFGSGMTFDEYVAYIGTPENLARAGTAIQNDPSRKTAPRRDFSAFFRDAFENSRLSDAQSEALRWIRSQPGGPSKILVISEDWSSDCRRDVPTLARVAADTGMELRIFRRDGQKFSDAHVPSLADAPDSNADIMAEFLKHSRGETWQSIPVAAFYTDGMELLYRYQEYPAIYEKDPLLAKIREPQPGESPADAAARTGPLFQALQDSAFFKVWASAAVDEIVSALHRKLIIGEV